MANDKTYDRHVNIWINGKEVDGTIKNIRKEMRLLKLDAEAAGYGTQKYFEKMAEFKKLQSIVSEHNSSLRETPGLWDKIKNAAGGSLGKILSVSGLITGAITLFKKTIESTEGSADKLREATALVTGGFQGFFHTVLSGDWRNLINNISATAKATRDLAAASNELEHIEAGNYNAKARREFLKNEALVNANQTTDPAEKKKYIQQAIDYQKEITAISVDELTKRAGLSADYYKNLAGQDKAYFDAFLKRVPEIAEHYEMQFSLLDGYKARLAELTSLQQLQTDRLTESQERERHFYQLLVYNLEDYKTLQDDLSKPGQWDEFIKSLGAITMEAAEGEASLKRLTKQLTTAGEQIGKNSSKISDFEKEILKLYDKYDLWDVESKAPQMPGYNPSEFPDVDKRIDHDIEAEKAANEERIKNQKETEQKIVDELKKGADEGAKAWKDNNDRELSDLEMKVQKYQEFGIAIGKTLGQAMDDGVLTSKEAAKALIGIALDALGQMAILQIGNATIKSFGEYGVVAGAARTIVLTALIEGAVEAAKSALNNMWTGGYTGPGSKYEPRGIVHAGEWVANADMVASPVTGPIIRALENTRVEGRTRGFASGGPVDNNSFSSDTLQPGITGQLTLKKIDETLLRVNQTLLKLHHDGVFARFTYLDADRIKRGMEKLDKIRGSASMRE